MRAKMIALIPALLAGAGFGYDPSALMARVNENNSAPSETAEIRMILGDKEGQTRERAASLWSRRRQPGAVGQMKLVRFSFPPELARSAVLTLENESKDDEQWIYIPAVYSSRKVPPKGKSERYLGTDFAYEDILTIRLADYSFKEIGGDTAGGRRVRVIEQVPASESVAAATGYSRVRHWVDPEAAVIWKSEYYGKDGTLAKRMLAGGLRKFGKYYRFDRVRMESVASGHSTVVEYSKRDTEAPVPAEIFTLRNLERG